MTAEEMPVREVELPDAPAAARVRAEEPRALAAEVARRPGERHLVLEGVLGVRVVRDVDVADVLARQPVGSKIGRCARPE